MVVFRLYKVNIQVALSCKVYAYICFMFVHFLLSLHYTLHEISFGGIK